MSADRTAANSDARKRNALRDSLVQQAAADAIREAKADAWDEGHAAGYENRRSEGMFVRFVGENPYRQESDR